MEEGADAEQIQKTVLSRFSKMFAKLHACAVRLRAPYGSSRVIHFPEMDD